MSSPGAGTPVVVSGWGQVRSGAEALELQYVVLHVLPMDKCAAALPGDLRAKLHQESSLCTLTPGKDHCKGGLGIEGRITGFLYRGLWRTHCSKKRRQIYTGLDFFQYYLKLYWVYSTA